MNHPILGAEHTTGNAELTKITLQYILTVKICPDTLSWSSGCITKRNFVGRRAKRWVVSAAITDAQKLSGEAAFKAESNKLCFS